MIRKHVSRSLLILLIGSSAVLGCQREHMRDDYGRQTRAFFGKQRVYTAASAGSPSGLDSEESALIKKSYRHSLGEPREEPGSSAASRVLLVSDDNDVLPKR